MKRVFLAGCILAARLCAQSSGIQGLVTDPTGAPVPDAVVTITNVATGVSSVVRTNERGLYSAPFLPPAFYNVRVEKAGFSPVTRERLKVDVDQLAAPTSTSRSAQWPRRSRSRLRPPCSSRKPRPWGR
jgi:hypothetical protein